MSHDDGEKKGLQYDVSAPVDHAPEPMDLALGVPLADAAIAVDYVNWRDERSVRRIRPIGVRFGSTEWHPERQWLLRAIDIDKGQEREFALRDCNFRIVSDAENGR